MIRKRYTIASILGILTLFPLQPLLAQGPLNPPGTPAPTMKSLDQIDSHIGSAGEKRVAINTTNTPGDTNNEAIITAPGSYYLAGNLAVAKANGIKIIAAGVTVDLNGFQISRASGSGGDALLVDISANNCVIKNGSVTGFAHGVECLASPAFPQGGTFLRLAVSGCSAEGMIAGDNWQIESCTARNNVGYGINAGSGAIITNCTSSGNTGSGIHAGIGSTLTNCAANGNVFTGTGSAYAIAAEDSSALSNCVASANNLTSAIHTGAGCTISNCSAVANQAQFGVDAGFYSTLHNVVASRNTSSKSASFGIYAGGWNTLVNCVAWSNTNSSSSSSDSTGVGIYAPNGTLENCTASSNKGDGFQVDIGTVRGCTANGNGNGAYGSGISGRPMVVEHCAVSNNKKSGIYVMLGGQALISDNFASGNVVAGIDTSSNANNGFYSRIDSNLVVNGNGTGILATSADLIVRNRSFSNTTNYSPSSGFNFGPFQAASNGSSTSTAWGNF
jgi:Right handed beta helix region